MQNELDIIIPIALDNDWPTYDDVINSILELYKKYGFKKFALSSPYGGWRAVGYPPTEFFKSQAELFLRIKKKLMPYGIECGWWIQTTLKSGRSDEFSGYVKEDGTKSFFHNCPLDDAFIKKFSEDVALFAEIAKPTFIITEDDYTIMSGCFCEHHLNEFARREGKYYSRSELLDIFSSDTAESYEVLKRWRELSKDSLVKLAEAIRREVDKKSPEIPIGYMQSGSTDIEGYSTEAISAALAGERHTPFVRLYGAPYCGIEAKEIPCLLYHALYSIQHIRDDFKCYHESDPFPQNKFFVAGKHMKVIMANAYLFGMTGSTFNIQQLLDDGNEEKVYANMFACERKRFNALYNALQTCKLKGVQICYDPFWNTADKSVADTEPLWTKCVSLFGIPYTTEESDVAFWDVRQAKHADDETVLKYLSKGLFLDGGAAKMLCERGFGEYLGVEIGEDVAKEPLCYDLAAREVICDKFRPQGKGINMPASHMFAMGRNGKLLKMTVKNPEAEVVSEEYTYKKDFVSPAMIRFKNKLGGKIVIMGETLENNNSQSLFNYRRKRLFEQMLLWCCDDFAFIREEPNLFTVVNEPQDTDKNSPLGIITITNLSADTVSGVLIHIPKRWLSAKKYYLLDINGEWKEKNVKIQNQELKLDIDFEYCEPVYIMIK